MDLTIKCLFCPSESGLTNEHVFPAALGGGIELKSGTCCSCNCKFSKDFEQEINRCFVPIRNMLSIPDRRGKIPEVDAEARVEGQVAPAKILAGGKVHIRPMKLTIENSSGEKQVIYRAFSREDEKNLLANLEAKGKSVEPEPLPGIEKPAEFEWKYGCLISSAAFRTVAKIAFVGFAYHFGSRLTYSEAFNCIRKFIADGSQESPAVRLFHNEVFRTGTQSNPFLHALLFAADGKEKKVWAIVILFGKLTYLVKLSDCWNGPDLNKTLGVDARYGTECVALAKSIDNEFKAVSLVLNGKTVWNDADVSAHALMDTLLQ